MFALSAARDLAIAIIITIILSAALSGLSSREQRQQPTVHYGVAMSPQNGNAGAAGLSPKIGGATFSAAERRR